VLLIDAVFALVTELGRRGTKTRLNPKRIELARPPEPENGLEGLARRGWSFSLVYLFCSLKRWECFRHQ
jgi:hypothetical protein